MSAVFDSIDEYPLGWEMESEDRDAIVRDAAPYLHLLGDMEETPKEVDYSIGIPVRSQESTPSCRGHSLAVCADACYRLSVGETNVDLDGDGTPNENRQDQFSALWCWVKSQIYGRTVGRNRGATMQGGIKVGLNDGIAREVVYPFSMGHTTNLTSPMVTDASHYKMGRYSMIDTENKMFQWLASGQGPAEWGTLWPLPFTAKCCADDVPGRGGGHATAIMGYYTGKRVASLVPALARLVEGEEYVYYCRNSHGSQAQYKGSYFVTRRGMERILRQSHTVAIGWSDMTTDKAVKRKIDWKTVKFA
jgi:hypothetical protein